MKNGLLAIHRFLLPEEKKLGYLPYVWLCYLGIYFFNYISRQPSHLEVLLTIVGMTSFLVLYFSAFRRETIGLILHILAIHLIGSVLAFYNVGASVFFVFAASFCANFKKAKWGFIGVGVIAALLTIQSLLLGWSIYLLLPGLFFVLMIGSSNIYFAEMGRKNSLIQQSKDEVKKMATVAERERIARDLHDLIGHTFSLITKKAELAQKLVDKKPEAAIQEIKDIEETSRDALAQVREAVTGYRKLDFVSELAKGKILCQAADIQIVDHVETIELPDDINQALAFIVKECLTNIVKHSNADKVTLNLTQKKEQLTLTISDNGSNMDDTMQTSSGNGLIGIRERVEVLNGKLTINTENGFQVTIELPIKG